MKAYVQYNDVVGTVAADVADWYSNSLQAFIDNFEIDVEETSRKFIKSLERGVL